MENKGRLYLIPSPLGEGDPAQVIPSPVLELLKGIGTYVVEEVRTARRYLSKAGLKGHIAELEFHELNEHTPERDIDALTALFDNGNDVALITEAGLPAVADPGSALVARCHGQGIRVIPCTGPSSLMMALMSSGLDGQSFAFRGYLPAKTEERRAAIRKLEKMSAAQRQTEIFIETPYRNDRMFADLLAELGASTRLCVAADITQPDEFIMTRSVASWRAQKDFSIGTRPCVFLILAK